MTTFLPFDEQQVVAFFDEQEESDLVEQEVLVSQEALVEQLVFTLAEEHSFALAELVEQAALVLQDALVLVSHEAFALVSHEAFVLVSQDALVVAQAVFAFVEHFDLSPAIALGARRNAIAIIQANTTLKFFIYLISVF